MLEEMQEMDAPLIEALANAVPDGAPGIVLRAIVKDGADGPSIAHEMEAVCRQPVSTPNDVITALRRRVLWGREHGQAFSSATYAVFYDGASWNMHASLGYPDNPPPQREPLREGSKAPLTFSRLVEQHILEALCKGARIEELAGDRVRTAHAGLREHLELDTLDFPLHAVPIATTVRGEWLWFWANKASIIDPAEARVPSRIREIGARLAIPDLVTPAINCGPHTAHELSYVAGNLIDADMAFALRDDRRTMWLLCWAPQLRSTALGTSTQLRIALSNLTQVDCNARRAVAWGLRGMRLHHRWRGREVSIIGADGLGLSVRFDELDRVAETSTELALDSVESPTHVRRELIPPPQQMTFPESPAPSSRAAGPTVAKAPTRTRRRFR